MSIRDKFNDSNSESDEDSFGFLEEPRIERPLKSPFDESIDSAFALLEHIITIKASVEAELDSLFLKKRSYVYGRLEAARRELESTELQEVKMMDMLEKGSFQHLRGDINYKTAGEGALTSRGEIIATPTNDNYTRESRTTKMGPKSHLEKTYTGNETQSSNQGKKSHADIMSTFEEAIASTFCRLQDIIAAKKSAENQLKDLVREQRSRAMEELEKAKRRLEFVAGQEKRLEHLLVR